MAAGRFAAGNCSCALNPVKRGVVLGLRLAIAAVFCYAGWSKLQSPQAFADSIATFQLLPARLINLLALGLPPFELAVGLWLFIGWKVRTAAFCGGAASVIFLLALFSALLRGLPVECGCFGDAHSSLAPTPHLLLAMGRDLLLAGAVWVVYFDACRRQREP